VITALASPAYADATGTLVVTGNAGGTSTAIAAGPATSPTYCPGSPTAGAKATSSGSVSVAVSATPASTGCPANQLVAGTYEVHFFNGNDFTLDSSGTYQGGFGCLHTLGAQGLIGTLTVDASGSGTGGPYVLPPNLQVNRPRQASSVCVTLTTNNGQTNAVPVTIVRR